MPEARADARSLAEIRRAIQQLNARIDDEVNMLSAQVTILQGQVAQAANLALGDGWLLEDGSGYWLLAEDLGDGKSKFRQEAENFWSDGSEEGISGDRWLMEDGESAWLTEDDFYYRLERLDFWFDNLIGPGL